MEITPSVEVAGWDGTLFVPVQCLARSDQPAKKRHAMKLDEISK